MINNQEAIRAQLNFWRTELNCDRILIAQFHNGTQSLSGCQFVKFDVTYTSLKAGESDINKSDFQNVHISQYNIIPRIWRYSYVKLTMSELKDIDFKLYSNIKQYAPKIKTCIFYKLTYGGQSDGVVMYLFRDNVKIDDTTINQATEDINEILHP